MVARWNARPFAAAPAPGKAEVIVIPGLQEAMEAVRRFPRCF
jgi:hypothetical protein